MATEAFKGISFALPRAGKLKVAREIGRRCGERWCLESPETLPVGYPDELERVARSGPSLRHVKANASRGRPV